MPLTLHPSQFKDLHAPTCPENIFNLPISSNLPAIHVRSSVLFLAPSVCGFFVFVWNISGTAEQICTKFTQKTCLVCRLDEFEAQRSRSPGTKKRHFSALTAAWMRFMFGKTSLASSLYLSPLQLAICALYSLQGIFCFSFNSCPNGILPGAKFIMRPSLAFYWQRYCTALEQWASAKRCSVVQGMELRNFRPTSFSREGDTYIPRSAITLGIGPHSS